MFYLVLGPFLLKNTFCQIKQSARSVSRIVQKVYIIGKIPFQGGRNSSLSCSVLEIEFCPNMDMGVAISDFSPIFELRHAHQISPVRMNMMSSNTFK